MHLRHKPIIVIYLQKRKILTTEGELKRILEDIDAGRVDLNDMFRASPRIFIRRPWPWNWRLGKK
ncbi:hypothetical protein ACJMK2_002527 [Sinanodonta woodiana]|uniref:Uncharacterized protein n=1 Tax=Sinanodonta woodiana TaxID=1069815 RepID=A0ABD3XXE3_SINWO